MDQSIKIAQDALANPPAAVAEALANAPAEARAAVAELRNEAGGQANGTAEAWSNGMDAKLQVGKLQSGVLLAVGRGEGWAREGEMMSCLARGAGS